MRTNNLDLVVYAIVALVIAVFITLGGCRTASAQEPKAPAKKAHVIKAAGKEVVCVAVTKTLTVCTRR